MKISADALAAFINDFASWPIAAGRHEAASRRCDRPRLLRRTSRAGSTWPARGRSGCRLRPGRSARREARRRTRRRQVHVRLAALLDRADIDAVSICLPDRAAHRCRGRRRRGGQGDPAREAAGPRCRPRARASSTPWSARRALHGRPHPSLRPALRAGLRRGGAGAAGRAIHLRAKRNGTRATARRLGATLVDPVLHGRPRCRRAAVDRPLARSPASMRGRSRRLGTGNEDALYAVVDFENGAIGCIDYSWAWPDGLMNGFRSAFEIVGTRAAAFLDVTDQGFYTVMTAHDRRRHPPVARDQRPDRRRPCATRSPILSMRRYQARRIVQHYREAFDAIPVLDALAESARTGMPVEVRR